MTLPRSTHTHTLHDGLKKFLLRALFSLSLSVSALSLLSSPQWPFVLGPLGHQHDNVPQRWDPVFVKCPHPQETEATANWEERLAREERPSLIKRIKKGEERAQRLFINSSSMKAIHVRRAGKSSGIILLT